MTSTLSWRLPTDAMWVTFDHEHVPAPILEKLEARGVAVRPGARVP